MFKNEVKKSIELIKLEALGRRLPKAHPSYPKVAAALAKALAGFYGEKSLEYYLSFLSDDYYILHNIRLQNDFNKRFFQMDFIILTPYCIVILEVKNITGDIFLDHKNKQLIYTKNDSEYVLPDPISQVFHHRRQLKALLRKHKPTQIPIETLVVLTKQSSKIKISPETGKDMEMVIRSTGLLTKMDVFNKIHHRKVLQKKDVRKLSNLLLKLNTPRDTNLFESYQIKDPDIITGVHCPNCFSIPMIKKFQKWFCSNCKFSSKSAHLDSIKDFSLLYKSTITNRELKNFLHLKSNTEAHYILKKMNVPYSGETKGRVYTLKIE